MNQPDDITQSAAEEVRALMARRNLNQADVGLALGRSQSYVSRALKGRGTFDLVDLGKLALLLGVTPATLLGPLANVRPTAPTPPADLAGMSEADLMQTYDLAASPEGSQTVPPPLPEE